MTQLLYYCDIICNRAYICPSVKIVKVVKKVARLS